MTRNHIHMSQGYNALSGMRKSCDLFIEIDVEKAMKDGIIFYQSENGVILTSGLNGFLDKKYFKIVKSKDGKVILD